MQGCTAKRYRDDVCMNRGVREFVADDTSFVYSEAHKSPGN